MWSALSADSSVAQIWALALAASFLGSFHCLGMCGPLVTLLARTRRDFWRYQLGRLASYLLWGAAAGALGSLLRWLGTGALAILILASVAGWLWRRSRPRPFPQGWLPGVAATLHLALPCGWMYSFVALAALSGAPGRGAGVMLALWLGGLPALAIAPWAFRRARQGLRRLKWPQACQRAAMLAVWAACLLLSFSHLRGLTWSMAADPVARPEASAGRCH